MAERASARILVASVQALIQHTIAPGRPARRAAGAEVGARVGQGALLRELLELGYAPVLEVAGRGEFARRGGIVDVFPPSADLPVRIEFFGDEIDSLRAFDPTDQRTTGKVDRVVLLPASEFLVPDGGRGRRSARGSARRRSAAGAPRPGPRAARQRRRGPDAGATAPERLRAARGRRRGRDLGAARWRRRRRSITSPPDTLFVLDEPGDLGEAGRVPVAPGRRAPRRPGRGRRAAEGLAADAPPAARLEAPAARRADARADLGVRGGRTRSPAAASRPATCSAGASRSSRRAAARASPRRWSAGASRTAPSADREAAARSSSPPTRRRASPSCSRRPATPPASPTPSPSAPPPGRDQRVDRSLNGGFAGGPDGLVFVTDRELFGNVRVRRPKAMRRVVPRDILERLTRGRPRRPHRPRRRPLRADAPAELAAPATSATSSSSRSRARTGSSCRSSRSGGSPATRAARARRCRKLGGTEWLRTKQRVRKAVADLAEELLALYASRASAPGHAYPADTPWQAEMEAAFPYEETVDQLRAVDRGQARHGGGPADGPARRRATSATARPRSRSAPRSRRPRTASRSRSSCRRRSSPPSTSRPSAPGSGRSRSRSRCCRGSSRRRTRRRRSRVSPTARWTSSSARTGCCRATCGSRTSGSWSSTRSSASGSPRRSGSSSSSARWTS